jgi:hypothetical protein
LIHQFHLSPRRSVGVFCGEDGAFVAAIPMLARARSNGKDEWRPRDCADLSREMSAQYGLPIDMASKSGGLAVIAKALNKGDLARAQIATLLLGLPDPPCLSKGAPSREAMIKLASDLRWSRLLKADWDPDEHPRWPAGAPDSQGGKFAPKDDDTASGQSSGGTAEASQPGLPPNAGWFARKPGETPEDGPPKGAAKPSESASSGSHKLAFAGVQSSLLARYLSRITLAGLARLAARVSAATYLLDAIFIPSTNPIVEEGSVPGRPDVAYRWVHDEAQVTFKALIDGQWRIVAAGERAEGGVYREQDGRIIARIVPGPDGRPTLFTSLRGLNRAIAVWRSANGLPAGSPTDEDDEPNLCPAPTPEPKTTKSANSIAYQEYVSKLPYGLAVTLLNVRYDGCDPPTGYMLEGKADIDFMFDENDNLREWVDSKSDPRNQMLRQAETARIFGRIVVWHAQTEKGYRGLKKIADELGETNLFVVYDPN